MSEKDCYQKNINSACGLLREEKEFTDVTLASEDCLQIESVCFKSALPEPAQYEKTSPPFDLHEMNQA